MNNGACSYDGGLDGGDCEGENSSPLKLIEKLSNEFQLLTFYQNKHITCLSNLAY